MRPIVLVSLCCLVGCPTESPAPAPAGVGPVESARTAGRLLDLEGREVDPFAAPRPRVRVFLFTRTDCPVSNRYAPEVRRLCEELTPRGAAFTLVYVDPTQDAAAIRAHLREYDYPCPALRDPAHVLVARAGARITPEAAVFTPPDTLVYRGRIDDRQVSFGKARPRATRRELRDAVLAALAGGEVRPAAGPPVGCFIADLK